MSTLRVLGKVFVQGQEWKKSELQDAIMMVRYLFAILIGSAAGSLNLTGLYVFLGFIGFSYSAGRLWLAYQGVDEDDYITPDDEKSAKNQPINFEGFPQSISMFVLSWVISYNFGWKSA